MDSVVNSSWVQGTALGILLLGGGFAIRWLLKELKLWQDKYLELSVTVVTHHSEQTVAIQALNTAIDRLSHSIEENKNLQSQTLQEMYKIADGLDVKDILNDIKRRNTRKPQS